MPALSANDFRLPREERIPRSLLRRRPKPPDRIELSYGIRLVMAVGMTQQQINQHIMPCVADWTKSVQARKAKADTGIPVTHTDVDEFEVIGHQFDRLRLNTHAREAPMAMAARTAAITAANLIAMLNEDNSKPVLQRLLRVDPFANEPWLVPLARDWVSENVSLIKSIGEKHLTDVEKLITRMVREGESIKTIRAELESVFGSTKQRARLIARDQVNKYNGRLTEERQVRAGINMYRWRTMQDRRVRGKAGGLYPNAIPNHAIMEGLLCRWSDSTMYFDEERRRWVKRTPLMEKLHPGQAIQDRCYAEPVLKNV